MSNISTPGERFTLWLNSDGGRVEKALAEMTADEVLQEQTDLCLSSTAEFSAASQPDRLSLGLVLLTTPRTTRDRACARRPR